jgi:ABC-type lipoprotein export system ATPase subunit
MRRQHIGYVFQDFNLLAGLTRQRTSRCRWNLMVQARLAARAAAMTVLDGLGLTALGGPVPG